LLLGFSGMDRLLGGADKDQLYGGGYPDALRGGGGGDRLYGGADADGLQGRRGTTAYTGAERSIAVAGAQDSTCSEPASVNRGSGFPDGDLRYPATRRTAPTLGEVIDVRSPLGFGARFTFQTKEFVTFLE
jgi:hypothetical protein